MNIQMRHLKGILQEGTVTAAAVVAEYAQYY